MMDLLKKINEALEGELDEPIPDADEFESPDHVGTLIDPCVRAAEAAIAEVIKRWGFSRAELEEMSEQIDEYRASYPPIAQVMQSVIDDLMYGQI